MGDRLLLLLYGGGAAGATWLGLMALHDWRKSHSLLRSIAWLLAAVTVLLAIGWVVFTLVDTQPVDLVGYPMTARFVVLAVFCFVGWLYSLMGARRWRSAISREESLSAYRSGWTYEGPGDVGRVLWRVGVVAVGLAFAFPEFFLGL